MKNLFIIILIVPFYLNAQKLPDNVEASIKKRLEYGFSPSYAIGIIDKKGARYYNFGTKTINGAPVDEHTVYEIGSISKVFTAILLAQQVANGKMKVDDPIRKYLPADVKIPQRSGKEITLGNLSDHTSGLPRMPTNFSPSNANNPYADYTVKQLFDFISGYELTRDIGAQYEYSNLAQGLLGNILALQAGTNYEALMFKNIATPLGMKETKITFDDIMKKNLAMGHSDGAQVENWDIPTLAGAGAIRSSTSDMLKFLAANMGLTKTSLRKAMDLSHQMRHDKAGDMRVGLGWHIAKGKNGDVIWHNGGTGGYRTFAGFVKETGVGVVVLTNSNKGADDIGFHLLNPDAPLQAVKASFLAEMKILIDANNVNEAIALYKERKKNTPDYYDFSESALNIFGYSYMDKNNLPAALSIFNLNVEQYPNSFNVYDSYGEALLKAAIENYKKSVELNPGNTSGIAALEKMGEKVGKSDEVVPESVLESYVGDYELQPGFIITITRDGLRLFEQATGQGKLEIFSKTATVFYLKVVEAQITFNLSNGTVESLTLTQNGQKINGKKVK
jgi:D-alanyl-D-alanine-carboxypeptidase/D-alanyl-D-alanine-endopeptidase